MQTDYEKYRGKCKEMAEAACKEDPSLSLVRGWYFCPIWGEQKHWWAKKPDGTIVDPTKDQFPSKGQGFYQEFTGTFPCEYCGRNVLESEAYIVGFHAYCSYECYGHDVGF